MFKAYKSLKPRPASFAQSTHRQENREHALEQLRNAGFEITEGKKTPKNGVYSGIVGEFGEVLKIDVKK